MKPSPMGSLGLFALVAMLAVSACGGSSSNSSAAIASCNSYCDAYAAKACTNPMFTSVSDCKTNECGPLSRAPGGNCQTVTKAYYDCRQNQADLCADNGCTSQFDALISACQ